MKIVQIVPRNDKPQSLKAMLKNTLKRLKDKGTTLYRVREGRIAHTRYKGWINWESTRGDILVAEVNTRVPAEEWKLLQSFIGYVDRHLRDNIQSISINYAGLAEKSVVQNIGPVRAANRKSERRHKPDLGTHKEKAKASSRAFAEYLGRRRIVVGSPRAIPFKSAVYVFTGRFECGTQADCAASVKARGATVASTVTKNTDVLVLGAKGSPAYLWKTFGRKIKAADDLRRESTNKRPIMITEYDWLRRL